MQFPVEHELHSSGSAAGEPQNQLQMFSLPVLAGREFRASREQSTLALTHPWSAPSVVCVGARGLCRESALSTWVHCGPASLSHSPSRTHCSELVRDCWQESPLSCCLGSKSETRQPDGLGRGPPAEPLRLTRQHPWPPPPPSATQGRPPCLGRSNIHTNDHFTAPSS